MEFGLLLPYLKDTQNRVCNMKYSEDEGVNCYSGPGMAVCYHEYMGGWSRDIVFRFLGK